MVVEVVVVVVVVVDDMAFDDFVLSIGLIWINVMSHVCSYPMTGWPL